MVDRRAKTQELLTAWAEYTRALTSGIHDAQEAASKDGGVHQELRSLGERQLADYPARDPVALQMALAEVFGSS
jgi:hypothetical protein